MTTIYSVTSSCTFSSASNLEVLPVFALLKKGDFWLHDNMRKVLQGYTPVQFVNGHSMTVAFVVDFFYGVKPGCVAGLCFADKGDFWMYDNVSEA